MNIYGLKDTTPADYPCKEIITEAIKESASLMGTLISGSIDKATKAAYINGLQRAVEIAKVHLYSAGAVIEIEAEIQEAQG